jgi:hypothetical protein
MAASRPPDLNTNAQVRRLLGLASYAALSTEGKDRVRTIINGARTSPRCDYYLAKLELLLTTPDAPPAEARAHLGPALRHSAVAFQAARAKLSPAARAQVESREERAVDAHTHLERLKNSLGYVLVDRSDPTDLVFRIKVHPSGSATAVNDLRNLEDAIEKRLATRGFTVDLEFVDKGGSDVFEIGCDPTKWPTSRNWIADANSLGHEVMHLLGLDDEYDLIEVHAGNAYMTMETRLLWFVEQLSRPSLADAGQGIMGNMSAPALDRHVCAAAQLPIAPCVRARAGFQLRQPAAGLRVSSR